jgi:hypothetical protein
MRGIKKSASFIFPTLARQVTPANLYRSTETISFLKKPVKMHFREGIAGQAPTEAVNKESKKAG